MTQRWDFCDVNVVFKEVYLCYTNRHVNNSRAIKRVGTYACVITCKNDAVTERSGEKCSSQAKSFDLVSYDIAPKPTPEGAAHANTAWGASDPIPPLSEFKFIKQFKSLIFMPSYFSSFPRRWESSGILCELAASTGLPPSGGAGVTESGDSFFELR
ncbi:MAG: hypothetical protein ACF8OB_15020 [Phycisphaeraceae bacterium JB051]